MSVIAFVSLTFIGLTSYSVYCWVNRIQTDYDMQLRALGFSFLVIFILMVLAYGFLVL